MADPTLVLRAHFPGVVILGHNVYLVTIGADMETVGRCLLAEATLSNVHAEPEGWQQLIEVGAITRAAQGLVEYVGGGMYRVGHTVSLSGGVSGVVVTHVGEIEKHLKPPPAE